MLGDFFELDGAAEPGDVLVGLCFDRLRTNGAGFTAPSGDCRGDAVDHLIGQLALHSADHRGELARVDEQHLALARCVLALGQEPQAGRYLRVEEQLAGQRDHDLHHVGLDHGGADLTFAVLA